MVKQKERINLAYQNLSSNYLINDNDFTSDCFQRQFYFFYRSRISELTERIRKNGLNKLGNYCIIKYFILQGRTLNYPN